jgi:predicted protein tyrosine phosphatase
MINLDGLLGIYQVDKDMAELGTIVLSRRHVLSWTPKQDNICLISITDPREEKLPENVKDKYKSVLELTFHDVLESSPWPERTIFNLDDAAALWEFFKNHLDEPMAIHCHAGISRSSGVAICRAFHDRATKLLTKLFDDKFSPNPTVVRKFLEYAEIRQNRSIFMRWDKI